MFDEDGEEAFLNALREEFAQIYPPETAMSLKNHLQCATELVLYVQEFYEDELKKSGTRAARHDIIAATLTELNVALAEHLMPILSSSSEEKAEDRPSDASSGGASDDDNIPQKNGVSKSSAASRHPLLE